MVLPSVLIVERLVTVIAVYALFHFTAKWSTHLNLYCGHRDRVTVPLLFVHLVFDVSQKVPLPPTKTPPP